MRMKQRKQIELEETQEYLEAQIIGRRKCDTVLDALGDPFLLALGAIPDGLGSMDGGAVLDIRGYLPYKHIEISGDGTLYAIKFLPNANPPIEGVPLTLLKQAICMHLGI
jgi:hypothetical protein